MKTTNKTINIQNDKNAAQTHNPNLKVGVSCGSANAAFLACQKLRPEGLGFKPHTKTSGEVFVHKIKAVIFDKDGVLLDSENCNVESGIMSFRDAGIKLDAEDIELIKGRHHLDYHPLLAKKYDFDEKKVLAKKMAYYWKLYDQAKLFPGVLELLSKLKRQHLKLALVTSSEKIEAKKMIDRFDLNLFDAIISFEDCQHRKPAPDCYLIAAKKLNVSPSECIVIEDSPIGVKAAKAAGMRCIAVTNTFPEEQLQQADYIIPNLNKIKDEWLQ